MSTHNKFRNITSGLSGINEFVTGHGIENTDHKNLFEPGLYLDNDEIDQILKENNISPLKNTTSGKKEKTEKFNLKTDFNFDYVDDEEGDDNNLMKDSQGLSSVKDTLNHVVAEDELFNELERFRVETQAIQDRERLLTQQDYF